MDYEREEMRRRREYEQAKAAQDKMLEKLAELKRAARSAKNRLLATTRSEQWHRMTLGWVDREAGYTGEMASARVWLRSQPLRTYVDLMVQAAQGMGSATNLEIEVAAVQANLDDWTARGDALLLERAKRDYAADAASFAAWRREHPDHESWRRKAPTRARGFLIARMTVALDIEPPLRPNRGEAHDWIAARGGNPRLGDEAAIHPPKPIDSRSEDAGAQLPLQNGEQE